MTHDATVHEVRVTLNDADLCAIALGLSEKSTAAQRALAREVLRCLIDAALDEITARIVGHEFRHDDEKCATCGRQMVREVLGVGDFLAPGRLLCPVHG